MGIISISLPRTWYWDFHHIVKKTHKKTKTTNPNPPWTRARLSLQKQCCFEKAQSFLKTDGNCRFFFGKSCQTRAIIAFVGGYFQLRIWRSSEHLQQQDSVCGTDSHYSTHVQGNEDDVIHCVSVVHWCVLNSVLHKTEALSHGGKKLYQALDIQTICVISFNQ